MILDRHHHFAFFKNKEIDALYFTSSLIMFAEGLVGIFIPIYFWQLGFGIDKILFFYLLHSLYFIIFSFIGIPVMRKFSGKALIFFSIPLAVIFFSGLNFIDESPNLIFFIQIFQALSLVFYNVGYHTDFSAVIDKGNEGKEVGTGYSIRSIVKFSAPFVGGVLIGLFGFDFNFALVVVLLILAVTPLFFFPGHHLSPKMSAKGLVENLKSRDLLEFHISTIGPAMEKIVAAIIWPLFIFLLISDFSQFGGLISIGLLISAVVTYMVGLSSDHGIRRKILFWSALSLSLVWIGKMFFASVTPVVGLHILGELLIAALIVTWGSQFYKLTEASSDPSTFILGNEVLHNIIRVLLIPVLIVFSYLLPLDKFFMASFAFAAFVTMFYLFANRQYYDIANKNKKRALQP